MPHKTRKQKKQSDKRREFYTIPPIETTMIRPSTLSRPLEQHPIVAAMPALSEHERLITEATIADLKKTIIVTVVLFALEFLVFYAKLKGISLF